MPDEPRQPAAHEGSVKETLISLLISFAMALVFRSYVVEAFIIPTGSMAPTLLGAHMRFQGSQTGNNWAVNPWYYAGEEPYTVQGPGQFGSPSVTDPMTTSRVNPLPGTAHPAARVGYTTPSQPVPLRAGDRILVQKYLYDLFPPKRFDVVVFKNPELSTQNFIKRLVGLPNEQVWLADGDIFTRPVERRADGAMSAGEWRIQRKPERVQRAVWHPVFSSEFTPLDPVSDGRRWFTPPWRGEGWQTQDRRSYRADGAEPGPLEWDSRAWPITNWVPYNEYPNKLAGGPLELFPVADLRLGACVTPDADGLSVVASLTARGHEYEAVVSGGSVVLRMRPLAPAAAERPAWRELARGDAPAFRAGFTVRFEFTHADQALEVRLDGRLVARAEYDWSPSQRLLYATGTPGEEHSDPTPSGNMLRSSRSYGPGAPGLSLTLRGSPVTLTRVSLDRDLYYEPAQYQSLTARGPALATHPMNLATLGPDQYFVLGDNSPASKDGRLWDRVDPWVADEIDGTIGVVPRRLLLGKAFFVYFPAPYSALGGIPAPDTGRMRFIR
jgi:signal peptidase I